MQFTNITIGNPSINIYQAVDGSMGYLTSDTIADLQVVKPKIISVGCTEVVLPNSYIDSNGNPSPFIVEGNSAGAGDLAIIVKTNGLEVMRKTVHLELREISTFYEKYVATTTTTDGDEIRPNVLPAGSRNAGMITYLPKNNEYVLFVHGWNMDGWDTDGWGKDRWAETTFKRLWWLGYQGSVGCFQWPTLGTTDYDRSEARAWRSGQALSNLLVDLNTGHPGQVHLLAHSMGNIVAGEAIRLAPANTVKSYIATQAAVPAEMYDINAPVASWVLSYTTPDVNRYYFSGDNTKNNIPYFSGNLDKVSPMSIFSYFNIKDWALGFWDINNELKPDNSTYGYFYDGSSDHYLPDKDNPASGDWFHSRVSTLLFPDNRFDIFAYCVQAHSHSLGASASVAGPKNNGFTSRNLSTPQFRSFDNTHYSHSREFRSDFIRERNYWIQVGKDFSLSGFKLIEPKP